jgi:hypothetical protein
VLQLNNNRYGQGIFTLFLPMMRIYVERPLNVLPPNIDLAKT